MAESVHFVTGTLKITVCEAKGIKNKGGLLSKMDPYAVLKLGKQKQKTRTIKNGGQTPVWNQELTFSCDGTSTSEVIEMQIWDADIGLDDLSSTTQMKIHDLLTKRESKDPVWFKMKHPKKDKDAGFVRVTVAFQGDLPEAYKSQGAAQPTVVVQRIVQQVPVEAAPHQPAQPVHRPVVAAAAAAQAHHAPAAAAAAGGPMPLTQGSKIRLKACSGKNLQILDDGTVRGLGGDGKYATFIVDAVKGNQVQLVTMAGKWLRIAPGGCDGKGGKGGPLVWLTVGNAPGGKITLRNAHGGVGVLQNGQGKDANKTGTGLHGQFTVEYLNVLQEGKKYRFRACSGKNLHIIPDGTVKAQGGNGSHATFVVDAVRGDEVQLQTESGKWLRIFPGGCDGNGGKGGKFVWLKVIDLGGGKICLRNAHGGVGATPDGRGKDPKQTGQGAHGQFQVLAV